MRASIFRVDSRVMGRVLAVALALTLTTGALAGCGSEDKPKADPSPTSKPIGASWPRHDAPEQARAGGDQGGAVEYARYFALLVQHAIRIRNVRPVMAEALDQAKCTTCRQLSEFIEQDMRDEKEWEITPDLRLGKFRARATSGGFVVSGAFEYPSGKLVDDRRLQEGRRIRWVVRVQGRPGLGRRRVTLAGRRLHLRPAEGLSRSDSWRRVRLARPRAEPPVSGAGRRGMLRPVRLVRPDHEGS